MSNNNSKPTFRRPKEAPVKPIDAYAEMSLAYHRRVEEKKLKSQNKQWGWSIVADEFEEGDESAPDWWE